MKVQAKRPYSKPNEMEGTAGQGCEKDLADSVSPLS